jgi:hypothetical protein
MYVCMCKALDGNDAVVSGINRYNLQLSSQCGGRYASSHSAFAAAESSLEGSNYTLFTTDRELEMVASCVNVPAADALYLAACCQPDLTRGGGGVYDGTYYTSARCGGYGSTTTTITTTTTTTTSSAVLQCPSYTTAAGGSAYLRPPGFFYSDPSCARNQLLYWETVGSSSMNATTTTTTTTTTVTVGKDPTLLLWQPPRNPTNHPTTRGGSSGPSLSPRSESPSSATPPHNTSGVNHHKNMSIAANLTHQPDPSAGRNQQQLIASQVYGRMLDSNFQCSALPPCMVRSCAVPCWHVMLYVSMYLCCMHLSI